MGVKNQIKQTNKNRSFSDLLVGYFYAPDIKDESILGMCTNSNNSLLVTGDTQGYIKVWDIMSHCVKLQDDGVSLLFILISY